MSRTIELPEDLADALADAATRAGMPLADYTVRLLRGSIPTPPQVTVRNGAELVAYWESMGLFGSRPDIEDSQAYARELREEAQNRRK